MQNSTKDYVKCRSVFKNHFSFGIGMIWNVQIKATAIMQYIYIFLFNSGPKSLALCSCDRNCIVMES